MSRLEALVVVAEVDFTDSNRKFEDDEETPVHLFTNASHWFGGKNVKIPYAVEPGGIVKHLVATLENSEKAQDFCQRNKI